MRIAVCDDEKEIRDMFVKKIETLHPKAELLLYQSGEELLLSDKSRISCCLIFRCRGRTAWKRQRNCVEKTKRRSLSS